MTDIGDIHIEWLRFTVLRRRDTSDLIRHLKAGGKVPPVLASLIADLLSGAVTAKPRNLTNDPVQTLKEHPEEFKSVYQFYKRLIAEPGVAWEWVENCLQEGGFDIPLDSKPEQTKAAKYLAAREYGRTLDQFDELMWPSNMRK